MRTFVAICLLAAACGSSGNAPSATEPGLVPDDHVGIMAVPADDPARGVPGASGDGNERGNELGNAAAQTTPAPALPALPNAAPDGGDAAPVAPVAPVAPAVPRAPGEPEIPHAALTAEIAADQIATRIAFLAGEGLEGRESGTPGGTLAEAYVAAEMSRLGFEPLGDAGSQFMAVPLPWQPLLPNKSFIEISIAGAAPIRSTPVEGSVPFSFSAGGTAAGDVVFAGYGLTTDTYDDWKGLDAKGKVAIVVRHGPREDQPESPFFLRSRSREQAERMSFAAKTKNAAAAGAVAVLFVNDQHHKDDPLPTSSPGEQTKIPAIGITRATANKLLAGLGKEIADLEHDIERDMKPQSVPVPGVRVSATATLGEAKARNIVFVRRGTDPALRDEAVVLGAHCDHVGYGWFGSLGQGGQIHNGADDNASGTSAMLEAAEAIAAGPATKRSIVFAAWCGEEKGLIGSAYWCDHPTWDLTKVVANVNLDMVGRYRDGDDDPRFQIEGGVTGSGLEEMAHRIAKSHGLRSWSSWESWEQSDHFSFYAKKIPALFLHTGLHPDYHRPADDWWKINTKGEAQIAAMSADLVRAIADMPERPAFKPKPPRPIIGVQLGDAPNEGGASLGMVVPKGPASEAGLLPQDVITSFGGKPVKDADALAALLALQKPGDIVEVTYRRGTETKTAKVKIGGR
jgi:Zn-dependent M28 family amino/carboxypeptidase